MGADSSLQERALVANCGVHGSAHQWIQPEVPGRSKASNPHRQHSINFNPRPVFFLCVCLEYDCWGFSAVPEQKPALFAGAFSLLFLEPSCDIPDATRNDEQEQPLLAQGTVLSQVQQGFVSEQGWQRDSEPAALD